MNLEWKTKSILWENTRAIFLTVSDVSRIIELKKEIAGADMKTILLRSVSHELRTPLNAIHFFVDEIINKPTTKIAEVDTNKLRIVSISSKLMLSLIGDLLDYSKILAGAFTVNKTNCKFSSIIVNACELITLQAVKKKLNLHIRFDPNIPDIIYTDSLRLSQVMLNLLSNALKFTAKG